MVEIHDQVTNFLSVQTHPAILVVFLGVVNHWVAIVAKRPNMSKLTTKQRIKHENGQSLTKIYLMDSSNMTHLDKKVIDLPSVVMQRVQEKIRLGLKATEKFLVEMTIQSLFD